MKTVSEIKSQLETETGNKFTVSKNTGSMKDYITFSVKNRAKGAEIDFNYGISFASKYPERHCYFSNNNNFSIHKSQLCGLN